jgi:capsid protein
VFLDMEPGDDARMLESATPSTQFQDFSNLMIMVALKALDIPFSFFDESHTNFFGSRGAWLHYERSCHDKRERLQELLRRLTIWRLMLFLLDGDLRLPAGTNISDLQWEWVPVGMPWWDPAKEINGDLLAIGAGLDNPQRITKERGRGDWYDNIDRIAEAIEYARGKQVPLSFVPGLMPPDEPEKHESGKDAKKKPPEKKAE